MMKAILRLMNYNSIFLKYLYISFFLFIYSYNSWSQQSESNREYVENKTNELTNDSSYWDNDAVIYFGANRTALYNWSAGGMTNFFFYYFKIEVSSCSIFYTFYIFKCSKFFQCINIHQISAFNIINDYW